MKWCKINTVEFDQAPSRLALVLFLVAKLWRLRDTVLSGAVLVLALVSDGPWLKGFRKRLGTALYCTVPITEPLGKHWAGSRHSTGGTTGGQRSTLVGGLGA